MNNASSSSLRFFIQAPSGEEMMGFSDSPSGRILGPIEFSTLSEAIQFLGGDDSFEGCTYVCDRRDPDFAMSAYDCWSNVIANGKGAKLEVRNLGFLGHKAVKA